MSQLLHRKVGKPPAASTDSAALRTAILAESKTESPEKMKSILLSNDREALLEAMRSSPENVKTVARLFLDAYSGVPPGQAANALMIANEAGIDTTAALQIIKNSFGHERLFVRMLATGVVVSSAKSVATRDMTFSILKRSLSARQPSVREHAAHMVGRIAVDGTEVPADIVQMLERLAFYDSFKCVSTQARSSIAMMSVRG